MPASVMAPPHEQELTPDLRAILVGPIVMGSVAQLILWGVMMSQATLFMANPSWSDFSPAVRVAVIVVVGLSTLSTCTAMSDMWTYGTSYANTVDDLGNPLVLSLELLLVGCIAILSQTVLAARASKVVGEGRRRKTYLLGLFALIAAEAGFWAWSMFYSFETAVHPLHHINAKIQWAQSHAFFLPQPAVYGISLLQTLSISDLSRRHSRDENPYLKDVSDPNEVVLPLNSLLGSTPSYIGSK
ncbi:hypothetical protein RQP46_011516 [Phenoliferia psychrophenolica]